MTGPEPTDVVRFRHTHFTARFPVSHRYAPSHFWMSRRGEPVDASGAEVWRVGMTRFATRMLGELVEMLLDVGPGDVVAAGQRLGSVEGFKAVSDLFSVVAWDHVSWPGNDFYAGQRKTDDGVKAAATTAMQIVKTSPSSQSATGANTNWPKTSAARAICAPVLTLLIASGATRTFNSMKRANRTPPKMAMSRDTTRITIQIGI